MTPWPVRPRRLALAVVLTVGVLAGGAVAAGAATPGPSPSAEQPADPAGGAADEDARRPDAADKAADKAARAARRAPVTGPAFVCDPALDHGQNVSAYARSLPKGPGRGRLVSQAARSDCGKPAADD